MQSPFSVSPGSWLSFCSQISGPGLAPQLISGCPVSAPWTAPLSQKSLFTSSRMFAALPFVFSIKRKRFKREQRKHSAIPHVFADGSWGCIALGAQNETKKEEKKTRHPAITSFRNLFPGPSYNVTKQSAGDGKEGLVYRGGTVRQTVISPDTDVRGLVSLSWILCLSFKSNNFL